MIFAIKKKILSKLSPFFVTLVYPIHAHHFCDLLFLADKTSLFDNLQPVLVFFF